MMERSISTPFPQRYRIDNDPWGVSNRGRGTQAHSNAHVPIQVSMQTLWDFDGSALCTAESHTGAQSDVQAMVLPNTDSKYVKDILEIDETFSKPSQRLFILVNPFWRDLNSWGVGHQQPQPRARAHNHSCVYPH